MLDFLDQGQALGPGILSHRQVHQEVLRSRVMNEVFEKLAVDFQVLRLALTSVDDGRDTATVPKLPGSPATAQRARIRAQWHRFHVFSQLARAAAGLTGPPALKFK